MKLRYQLSFLLLCAACFCGRAQGGGVAVIIDSDSYSHCREALDDYKKAIENDGLPVFVKAAAWQTPEQVRDTLKALYGRENIEGAVLVGDIPIPMVMKAQYMTSAYKMDERKYPLEEVAVPSDRFYDDFDLKFTPLDAAPQGLMHFYELAEDSLPYIECDIYTGRIKAQASYSDPYAQISAYLHKAARAHRTQNPFDQFTSFTGHGSYSGCITAWRAERRILDEQFGDTFKHRNARFLRYSMADYPKDDVIRELQRQDLDFMVFHEHGDWFRMYLSGSPEERDSQEVIGAYLRRMAKRDTLKAAGKAAEWGLTREWYADYDSPERAALDSLEDLRTGIILEEVDSIAPNARMVVFDACYNGDFRNPDFIAGKFVMGPGECLVGFANSVNVLQDKSSFDLMGLLGRGARVGLWAQHINILESHIIGDPTFRFTPSGEDVNPVLLQRDPAFWAARLGDSDPEIQNMAAIRLFEAGWPEISDILYGQFCDSPFAIVRYNAMTLLERLGDANYHEALKRGVTDGFEFIRRISVNRMGDCGDEEFLPYLIDAYVNDRNSARVVFNVTGALSSFDNSAAEAAVERYFAGKDYYNAANDKAALLEAIRHEDAAERLAYIADPESPKGYRKAYVDFLRNVPLHQITDGLLEVAADPSQDELVRTLIVESLSWYELSRTKPAIVKAFESILDDPACPEGMKPALQRGIKRLSTNK